MKHKYSEEQLREIVARSKTWADVCRELGIPPASGSQTHLAKRGRMWGVDCSHFVGQAWNKGKTYPKKSIEFYLTNPSSVKSSSLRDRLIRSGLKERKCEICGLGVWQNKPIPLELDHKNSNHWDCRIENIQILCPNCHAQVTNERRHADVVKTENTLHLDCSTFGLTGSTPVIGTKTRTKVHVRTRSIKLCTKCGKSISKQSTCCKSCAMKGKRNKIQWPSKEEILERLEKSNFVKLSKELGVSDNAIRKHLRSVDKV